MGVEKGASESEIKSAYYEVRLPPKKCISSPALQKAKIYHPDVNKESHAQRRFVEITEAYKVKINYKMFNHSFR